MIEVIGASQLRAQTKCIITTSGTYKHPAETDWESSTKAASSSSQLRESYSEQRVPSSETSNKRTNNSKKVMSSNQVLTIIQKKLTGEVEAVKGSSQLSFPSMG